MLFSTYYFCMGKVGLVTFSKSSQQPELSEDGEVPSKDGKLLLSEGIEDKLGSTGGNRGELFIYYR